MFVWNLLLALLWAGLNSSFKPSTLTVGFVIGYLVIGMLHAAGMSGAKRYVLLVPSAIAFTLFFIKELIAANVRMSIDLFRSYSDMKPGVIAVPLQLEKDSHISLLASLVTLTPGTLSLDVSRDKSTLYVHAMYLEADGGESVRKAIKHGFERRIIALLQEEMPWPT